MDVRFPKKIEPGLITTFDFNIKKSDEKEASGDNQPMEIRLLTLMNGEFNLDKATYDDVEQPIEIKD